MLIKALGSMSTCPMSVSRVNKITDTYLFLRPPHGGKSVLHTVRKWIPNKNGTKGVLISRFDRSRAYDGELVESFPKGNARNVPSH